MEAQEQKKRAADKLIFNLEDLTKAYRQVLELVRKEKDLLIDAKIDDLHQNNAEKEKMVVKLRSLDALRVKYAAELSRLVGIEEGESRLLEIARRIDGSDGDKLRTQQASLDLLIRRVREINQSNAEYAESALQRINGAMSNLKESVSGKKTYGPKGKMQNNTSTTAGNFVSKET